MQYKEAERLANNYHKNRLIDLKRARFHYHEAMKELLTGKRSAFAKQPSDRTKSTKIAKSMQVLQRAGFFHDE